MLLVVSLVVIAIVADQVLNEGKVRAMLVDKVKSLFVKKEV